MDEDGRNGCRTEVLEHASRIMSELDAPSELGRPTGIIAAWHCDDRHDPNSRGHLTVPLVCKIRDSHPQLSMRFTSAFSGHLLDWVQRGELDLAVSYDPQPLKSLRITPVTVDELLLVGRGVAPVARKPVPGNAVPLAWSSLCQAPSRPRGRGLLDWIGRDHPCP